MRASSFALPNLLHRRAAYLVLDLASEDATPLFDVTTIVRELAPNEPAEAHINAARVLVYDLLARNYVILVRDTAQSGQRELTEAGPDDLDYLDNDSNWVCYADLRNLGSPVFIAMTPEGAEALTRGEFPSR